MGKLRNEVSFEAEEGVGVGSGVGGEVELELGLEGGVVVDGFDEGGEDVVGRDGVLEESKFGNVDLVVGEVGWEVGWVDKPGFELGFEFEEVGCGGGAVLCCHPLHDDRDGHCCHSKNRIRDEGAIGRADGVEQDGGEFSHSRLVGVESFELPFVGTDEGVGGSTGRSSGHWPRRDGANCCWRSRCCDVGGVVRPLCCG